MLQPKVQLWLTLTVLGRDTATWVVPPGESLMVGRDESANDLVLHHPNVSRTHARLVARARTYAVMDLASTKGTFINGERLMGARELVSGDVMRIGPYRLRAEVRPWKHEDEDHLNQTINSTTSLP